MRRHRPQASYLSIGRAEWLRAPRRGVLALVVRSRAYPLAPARQVRDHPLLQLRVEAVEADQPRAADVSREAHEAVRGLGVGRRRARRRVVAAQAVVGVDGELVLAPGPPRVGVRRPRVRPGHVGERDLLRLGRVAEVDHRRSAAVVRVDQQVAVDRGHRDAEVRGAVVAAPFRGWGCRWSRARCGTPTADHRSSSRRSTCCPSCRPSGPGTPAVFVVTVGQLSPNDSSMKFATLPSQLNVAECQKSTLAGRRTTSGWRCSAGRSSG